MEFSVSKSCLPAIRIALPQIGLVLHAIALGLTPTSHRLHEFGELHNPNFYVCHAKCQTTARCSCPLRLRLFSLLVKARASIREHMHPSAVSIFSHSAFMQQCGLTTRSTGPIAAGRHLGYKSLAQMPTRRNGPFSSNVSHHR